MWILADADFYASTGCSGSTLASAHAETRIAKDNLWRQLSASGPAPGGPMPRTQSAQIRLNFSCDNDCAGPGLCASPARASWALSASAEVYRADPTSAA